MESQPTRVGVRELRQNLSVYLKRVKRGEHLEVTEHGRAVAVLAPAPGASSPMQRLALLGRLIPPEGDLRELLPPKGRISTDLSDALREQRAEKL